MPCHILPPLDSRIPKWDIKDLIERSCPICGLTNLHPAFQRPDGLHVIFCVRCHAHYVSPCPSKSQLDQFYETYDLNHRRSPKISPDRLLASYKRIKPFSDLRIRELSTLMTIEGAKVLDVGFGRGRLLHCLQRLGAEPFGLELDPMAMEYASTLGIVAYKGHLNDFRSELKFKLITMVDLLEHPLNPMEMLSQASELLDNDGLLMIWTPNGDCTRFEDSPTTFRVDLEHMQYLSPDTLTFAACKLNLRMIHLETLGFPGQEVIRKSNPSLNLRAQIVQQISRRIPGHATLCKLRKRLSLNTFDDRNGAYHLFCIMRKQSV